MSDTKMSTNGEFLVGITFNPGKHEAVEKINRLSADLIDTVEALGKAHTEELKAMQSIAEGNAEVAEMLTRRISQVPRLVAMAVTSIEHAAMNGVKAVTK